ncbi:hypothetical protein CC1G_12462 [Coprinopsis cinerea okayama7|uniref:Uncharacterized protein n=1 Tax=Coprinopsis cinerea (strain Okayama-7 / 130 / ATCC MYA-4618 / FGSC 9003) TaxID=240176 RepID=A8NL03_COPC7|nr:hypothetical protein CC1G_12462 [Coprinopsis cinerea okayama7\|eukprot:XP_001834584.2 hypothetical protein CC1G_12462 [Coprinopsis cinerea okayama7\
MMDSSSRRHPEFATDLQIDHIKWGKAKEYPHTGCQRDAECRVFQEYLHTGCQRDAGHSTLVRGIPGVPAHGMPKERGPFRAGVTHPQPILLPGLVPRVTLILPNPALWRSLTFSLDPPLEGHFRVTPFFRPCPQGSVPRVTHILP